MPIPAEPRRRRLQRSVLAWYRAAARSLPWRTHPDPYLVLVSEVMLQQTQVSRVEPVFAAFVERFPDVEVLAQATAGEVLRAWGGLGYNRRALNLHRAARVIVEEHAGRIPAELDALLGLPGVGPYTARAIAAFAHGRDEAPVDTNVARVLARAVHGAPLTPAQAQRLADGILPAGEARDWGQALMDLGARFCTARAPRCDACPLASLCAWRSDPAGPDPARRDVSTPASEPFAGSDRYHRGRIVDALRRGPLGPEELLGAAELDDTGRLVAITGALEDDGLVEWREGRLSLPG